MSFGDGGQVVDMNTCYSCGGPATRACTHCGKYCCEGHIAGIHGSMNAGVVCTGCAQRSRTGMMIGLGVVVIGIISLAIVWWQFFR